VAIFEAAGIEGALTYPCLPESHPAGIRTLNILERLFEEVEEER
jgi:hypothetical protein